MQNLFMKSWDSKKLVKYNLSEVEKYLKMIYENRINLVGVSYNNAKEGGRLRNYEDLLIIFTNTL